MQARIGTRQLTQAISLFVLAVLLLTGCSRPPQPTPTPEGVTVIDPPGKLTDFTLTSQKNAPLHLSDLKGKLVLLSFGYTHCPDVCPITLANYKLIKTVLADKAEQVNFVFVGVDTKRDTPARLTEYLKAFDSTFIGLTGDQPTLQSVIKEFGGLFNVKNAGGLRKEYTVEHTASWYLIDDQGLWRRKYAYGTAPDVVAADITQVLTQIKG